MATITSTIKLVDQMSPTLNKISKAIDRVNAQSKSLGSAKTWNGFNTGVQRSTKSTHNLYNAMRRVMYTLMALRGLQGLTNVADSMMNATARINNINDGLYTTSQYLDIIYGAAQRSRGSFLDMASAVGKLGTIAGDAFGSVNEMVAFTELMNKLFTISGASAAEASNAMYQLTQAMAAGRLQGDEMRSILENAPLLAKKIADSLGVTTGELKELGAEGKITADVIKDALFGAADEIEERFSKMPKTIGQIWNEIKNHCLNAFRPVIDRVQQFINSPTFEKFKNKVLSIITAIANGVIKLFNIFETPRMQNAISNICNALGTLWDILVSVGNVAVNVAQWICENWSWIAPIVYTVIAAFLIYKAICLVMAVVNGICAVVNFLLAAGLLAVNAAGGLVITTFGWIVIAILAVILIIYLAVAAWNHFKDDTVSATGIIFGSVAAVVAAISALAMCLWDTLVYIKDLLVAIVTNFFAFLGNLFMALGSAFIAVCQQIEGVGRFISALWTWVGENITTIFGNVSSIINAYFTLITSNATIAFSSIVIALVNAMNSMITSTGEGVRNMLKPIASFVDKCIAAWNKIANAWNSTVGGFGVNKSFEAFGKTFTIDISIPKMKTFSGSFSESIESGSPISANQFYAARSQAIANKVAAQNTIAAGLLAGTTAMPSWGDYVDFGAVKDAWKEGMNSFEYEELPTYNVDWGSVIDNAKKAYDEWYKKGEAVEDGVTGLINGIGLLISGLFGGGGGDGDDSDGGGTSGSGSVRPELPSSLEDLLSGYSPGGGALGDIADNTGSTAGSAGNIEDTLNLAEEELELLRKLAEQEVINRFTTAEIKVDMTNNNSISSKMDLDGIVTHLSNKLYEELGVVANGVHY